MAKKTRKSEDIASELLQESTIVYQRKKSVDVLDWNPNVPVHATQEEWWEHFHKIEKEQFTPLEIANQEFEEWRKKYFASKLLYGLPRMSSPDNQKSHVS